METCGAHRSLLAPTTSAMLCGHLASDATELHDRAAIAALCCVCAAFLWASADCHDRARAAIPVSRSGVAHVHASRDARKAFATLVTSRLTSTELGHNRSRGPHWLPICPCAHGRAVVARTLRAASTSAIMCDISSWLRLPPLVPAAPSIGPTQGPNSRLGLDI